MPLANVKSGWKSGNLVFEEAVIGNGAAIHFGVDDDGLDVKFFGATSGKYALWDESADKLIVAADFSVSGAATFTGAVDLSGATVTGMTLSASVVAPDTSDGAALGSAALMWSDLFLASGGVINFNNGDVTLTHSADVLTIAGGRLASTFLPAAHTDSAISAGVYGTPLVDATLVDNILFSVNYATATNKTAADTSCMAAFIGVANTAATTNNKMQGLLVSNTIHGDLFDAYAVQGHVTVHDAMSTQNANAHITGLSGKALISAAVGQGWVTGVLAILEGAGGVTGLAHALAAQVEAGTVGADAIAYLGADATVAAAIDFAGTANMTNIFKFNAAAGSVVTNALVPSAAPDGGTVGADLALVCDVGGTPYYIPLYDTLHA